MKRITAMLLIIVITLSACSAKGNQWTGKGNYKKNVQTEKNDFVSAVWLSYNEIARLSKKRNEKQFKEEIINLTANLLSFGIDTVIVHAVAFCDSLYGSEILPKSQRLDKSVNYDVFKIICELCSQSGISVQAWINPYRVSTTGDLAIIRNNEAVKEIYSQSSDNLIINKDGIYLNPASPQAQRLILDEARELIDKYNICAIHIDDYFYPDMTSFPDKGSYEKYRKNGGSLSVEDWRRENVNALISSLHTLVKSYGKLLAISPAADIEKNYSLKYADISHWLDNGWADYIMPQLYFGFDNETMPFENVLEKWIEETKDKPTRLIIGLAAYKCANEDLNAGSGKDEWKRQDDIISRQVSLILKKNTICGVAFFSYSYIFDENLKKITKKELQNIKSML